MRREEQIQAAETEALFREVNEQIAESAQRLEADEGHFVCECSDPGCVERVATPMEVYEEVRDDGATFLVAPGHEDERYERILRRPRGYRIVRKLREVGALVRRLDPRANEA